MPELFANPECEKTAHLSSCGRYRYSLTRKWGPEASVGYIMLNPSTADASDDDPTIRKCIGFAKKYEFGGIVVRNLFNFRSKSPTDLPKQLDPIGDDGDKAIKSLPKECALIIVAWGNIHKLLRNRATWAIATLGTANLFCLGINEGGSPKHPLYVPYNAPLLRFPVPH